MGFVNPAPMAPSIVDPEQFMDKKLKVGSGLSDGSPILFSNTMNDDEAQQPAP